MRGVNVALCCGGRVMEAMPRLQTLNAQYNQFHEFRALRPIGSLRNLEKLALHGCPLHERVGKKAFRHGVLSMLHTQGKFKQLDFTGVTIQEVSTNARPIVHLEFRIC
jgi:Leucine-rich repeat (LRR) protein